MSDSPPNQRSKHALVVTATWATCMAFTALVFFVLILLLRTEAITWQTALSTAGLWSMLSISIVMFMAVGMIHKLEREMRQSQ